MHTFHCIIKDLFKTNKYYLLLDLNIENTEAAAEETMPMADSDCLPVYIIDGTSDVIL